MAYTCRYFSGQLIPIFQSVAVTGLRFKGPLEYLQVWATTLVSLSFIYMIPIACKITFFIYLCNLSIMIMIVILLKTQHKTDIFRLVV